MKAGFALLPLAAVAWATPVSTEISVNIVARDDTFATAVVFHLNELREIVSNATANITAALAGYQSPADPTAVNGTVNGFLSTIVTAISGTADALNTLPKSLPTGNLTLVGDDARSIGMESFRVIRFITISIRNISGTLGPGALSATTRAALTSGIASIITTVGSFGVNILPTYIVNINNFLRASDVGGVAHVSLVNSQVNLVIE